MSTAPVRITSAIVASSADGIQLEMQTTEGVNVSFLLDDVALTLLTITMRSAVAETVSRNKAGSAPRVFSTEA